MLSSAELLQQLTSSFVSQSATHCIVLNHFQCKAAYQGFVYTVSHPLLPQRTLSACMCVCSQVICSPSVITALLNSSPTPEAPESCCRVPLMKLEEILSHCLTLHTPYIQTKNRLNPPTLFQQDSGRGVYPSIQKLYFHRLLSQQLTAPLYREGGTILHSPLIRAETAPRTAFKQEALLGDISNQSIQAASWELWGCWSKRNWVKTQAEGREAEIQGMGVHTV